MKHGNCNECEYALVKYFAPKAHYFAPWDHYFAHWCAKRPFSLCGNGAQTRFLHACVKKKAFPFPNRNDKLLSQRVSSSIALSFLRSSQYPTHLLSCSFTLSVRPLDHSFTLPLLRFPTFLLFHTLVRCPPPPPPRFESTVPSRSSCSTAYHVLSLLRRYYSSTPPLNSTFAHAIFNTLAHPLFCLASAFPLFLFYCFLLFHFCAATAFPLLYLSPSPLCYSSILYNFIPPISLLIGFPPTPPIRSCSSALQHFGFNFSGYLLSSSSYSLARPFFHFSAVIALPLLRSTFTLLYFSIPVLLLSLIHFAAFPLFLFYR